METLNEILQFVPTSYIKYVLPIMLLGRIYYALRKGGGIKGIWNSTVLGTNTPQDKNTKTPSSNGPSEPRP